MALHKMRVSATGGACMTVVAVLACLSGLVAAEADIFLTRCQGAKSYPTMGSVTVHSQKSSNYTNNIDCKATISIAHGHGVHVVFDKFELQPKGADGECKDFLQIFQGRNIDGTAETMKLCGDRKPHDVVMTYGSVVTLWFHTDATMSDYSGFTVNIVRLGQYKPPRAHCYSCQGATKQNPCFNDTDNIDDIDCTEDKPYCFTRTTYERLTDEFVSIERGCTSGTMEECIDNIYCSTDRCNSYKCNHNGEKNAYKIRASSGSSSVLAWPLFPILTVFSKALDL